jgi:hypothetical protein
MRSEILMAADAKITFFWDMMTCSLIESYQHLGRNLLHSTVKMEAAGTYETLISFSHTI